MGNKSFHIILVFIFLISNQNFANIAYPRKSKSFFANVAPIITATGNQIYCPGSSLEIVTGLTIIDPDNAINEIYIQISAGYINGQDLLTLNNPALHPTIGIEPFNPTTGKLRLFKNTSSVTTADFEAAIKDIAFSNSSAAPSGTRDFSISIGQANYLPGNGHYYLFVADLGITWTNAKTAAEGSNYYGLKGYLATITSADEAKISGEQAAGAGWIGGSDAETEGVWKWVTGPEGLANGGAGTIFWNGLASGSAPPNQFAFWNTNEPNQAGNEDYAHVTAPGIGIKGSWNDLSNTGETGGNYQPKGYIVEYGGMLNDPILQISASTKITIIETPTSTEEVILCQGENTILDASIPNMTYLWSPGGETTQTIEVSTIGEYSVTISSPTLISCDSKKDISVIEHPKPVINSIGVNESSITVELANPESYYEYSVDGAIYQVSNQFSYISSGQHTAFVRDNNGCNLVTQDFAIFTVAKYFTPNNDGFNDVWEIKEMGDYPNANAQIYDRYGKLIIILNSYKYGWDGKFNNKFLPADDYWYRLKLDDAKPEITGHFTLKR